MQTKQLITLCYWWQKLTSCVKSSLHKSTKKERSSSFRIRDRVCHQRCSNIMSSLRLALSERIGLGTGIWQCQPRISVVHPLYCKIRPMLTSLCKSIARWLNAEVTVAPYAIGVQIPKIIQSSVLKERVVQMGHLKESIRFAWSKTGKSRTKTR